MEKELKSRTGVILRADLTGDSHPSPFCQNRTPVQDLIIFPSCSTGFIAPHIKKMETYFALLYFWTFAQCVRTKMTHEK